MGITTIENQPKRTPRRYNGSRPADNRPPARPRRTARPLREVRIAGTEWVTMTPAELDDAIEALAVLIRRYLDRDHSPPDSRAA